MSRIIEENGRRSTEKELWADKKRTIFGLPISFTKYTLTDTRLIIKSGFLNIKEDEIMLYRITDITYKASLWERMFGVGKLFCDSADKSAANFIVGPIKEAAKVRDLLSDNVDEQRDKKRIRGNEFFNDSMDDDMALQKKKIKSTYPSTNVKQFQILDLNLHNTL